MNDPYAMGFLDGEATAAAWIARLETLIDKYAQHVSGIEGVSYLEDRYRGMFGSKDTFTDEEYRWLTEDKGLTCEEAEEIMDDSWRERVREG